MTDRSFIPQNIDEILQQASKYISNFVAEDFVMRTECELLENSMQSPIEFALYIGLKTVCKFNFIDETEPTSTTTWTTGIGIYPQYKIDKYRADFLITYHNKHKNFDRSIVVECDGTAFHERTEKERRQEKQRDRHMQKLDLKVFRYTGSEILKDPYQVAAEIIGYVIDGENYIQTPQQYFSDI